MYYLREGKRNSMMDLQTLKSMSNASMDELWSDTSAGIIPDGVLDGTVLISPNRLNRALTKRIALFAWQGKTFNAKQGTLTNRVNGLNVVTAQVYRGPSWYDHAECIVLDYSRLPLRDEIRQVDERLYLGKAYVGTNALIYFALVKPDDQVGEHQRHASCDAVYEDS